MEVCSSTEMDAPGASHLGTGDHEPKTDRSRPRSVPVNGLPPSDLPQLVGERPIANALIERLEAAIHNSGRVTAHPEVTPKRV
jgi:hypothetical protein